MPVNHYLIRLISRQQYQYDLRHILLTKPVQLEKKFGQFKIGTYIFHHIFVYGQKNEGIFKQSLSSELHFRF